MIDVVKLREQRGSVLRQDPLYLSRERVPDALAHDLVDQCLVNGVDAVLGSHVAQSPIQALRPLQPRGREAEGVTLEQDQRPHLIGIAKREVDRHRSPIAPADDDRRHGLERIEQRGGIVCLLAHRGLLVGHRALAPGAPAPVVGDHAAEGCQPR